MEEVLVSICCITYNQEKYIEKALDSFLMQKTNFKYEIIVHDDASTDRTVEIIKKYQKKFPEIIKPIFEKENQYSKGKKATILCMEKAIGKYIAICEGDDYWTDNNKLQKQVDYMEKNENCTLCFHNAYIYDEKTKKIKSFMPYNKKIKHYMKKNNKYDMGELTLLSFIPTASIMFRRKNIIEIPEFYKNAIVGDIPIRLINTYYGYAYYMDDIMSVYRVGTNVSMTDKFKQSNKNKQKAINHKNEIINLLKKIDEFYGYEYTEKIQEEIKYHQIDIFLIKNDYKKIISKEYIKQAKNIGIIFCLKSYVKSIFYKKYIKLKGVVSGKK